MTQQASTSAIPFVVFITTVISLRLQEDECLRAAVEKHNIFLCIWVQTLVSLSGAPIIFLQ